MRSSTSSKDGPRINEDILVSQIQLIDDEGNNLGVVPIQEALSRAEAVGLDLVEVVPNASPPVCKILDYGRYKYQAQKKAAEARKKQKTADLKELKLRPNIDKHDYEVKLRNVKRFIESGDKVKITMRFRGREMAHAEIGQALLERLKEDTAAFSRVESEPKLEGRQMMMVLMPLASSS